MSLTHEELARSNFVLSDRAATPEWRVTMLFYAALHAVSHVLFPNSYAGRGFDHKSRGPAILQHPKLKAIDQDYRELYGLALSSRYMPREHPMPLAKVNRAFTLTVRVLGAAGISTSRTVPQAQGTEPGVGQPAAQGESSSVIRASTDPG